MGRTDEEAVPVDEHYRKSLRDAVKGRGGQKSVAKETGVNQSTVSRTLKTGGRATYTTMAKLSKALDLPAPVVPVRDADHALWCRLGSMLADRRPAEFRSLLTLATSAASALSGTHTSAVDESALTRLADVVSDPLPGRQRKRD
jgi:DNA-binding phage protein